MLLPNFRGSFASVKDFALKSAFRSTLRKLSFKPESAIFYSLHFAPLLTILKEMRIKIAYDCVDDTLAFPEFTANKYQFIEEELIKSSSACFATSKSLQEKIKQYNSQCIYLPNAMDFQHFNSSIKSTTSYADPYVTNIMHPVIGFIGAVFDWINVDLICKLAEAHPTYSILLVGPVNYGKEKLERYTNITMVGTKPYESLPFYLSIIDVCLIPFKLNKITLASNPIKMYEYLAAGKPVVSTALPEVISNASEIVAIGKNDSDFISKVEFAVEHAAVEKQAVVNQRLEFAKENSWDNRAQVFEKVLNQITAS